jgi:predicted RNA-binding Zn ribbon-like protein
MQELTGNMARVPYSRPDAPSELKTLETYCNSARFLYGEDAFSDPASAMRWLRDHGLGELQLDQTGLDQLIEVREAIRDHLDGVAPEATSAVLNHYAHRTLIGPEWTSTGQAVLRSRADNGAQGLLGHLLVVLFTAGTRGALSRLKTCRARDCRWIFYDRSPSGNSVWCSMDICGARNKMRTYRSRAKES